MAVQLDDLLARLRLDTSGLEKGLGQAEAGLKRAGSSMKSTGDKMTKGVTLPLVGLGTVAAAASKKFGAEMGNVATLIPGATDRVDELANAVQDMAVRTGKDTSDLTDGLYNVVSAFGDTADTTAILETNARAAAAGLASTQDAINLTSAVTKAYGDTSKQAVTDVADMALMTVRLGQTTFPELASSIGRVTPMANELGVSQQELFGSMATLTGVTGGAAEVSTQLRGTLQALMSPTADAAKAIESAGYASGKALIEEKGLAGATQFLVDAAKKSGVPLQKMVSSLEGQTFALALTGTQADTYKEKLKQVGDAAGTTDVAFEEATGGMNASGFAMDQAKAKAQVLAQRVGDGLGPALVALLDAAEPVIDALLKMADTFANMPEGQQKMIVTTLALVAAMGPVLGITGRLVGVVGGLAGATKGGVTGIANLARGFSSAEKAGAKSTGAMGTIGGAVRKMGSVFATVVTKIATALRMLVGVVAKAMLAIGRVMLANPWILLVVALIAVVVLIVKHWDKVKAFLAKTWAAIKTAASAAWNGIKAMFRAVLGAIKAVVVGYVKGYLAVWRTVLKAMRAAAAAVWGAIKAVFRAVLGAIKAVVTGYVKGYLAVWKAVLNTIKAVSKAVWNGIKAVIGGVLGAIKGVVTKTTGAIKSAMTAAWNAVKSGTTAAWNGIKSAVSGGISKMMALIRGLPGQIKGFFSGAGGWLLSAGSQIIGGLISGITGALGGLKDKLGAVTGLIPDWKGPPERDKTLLTDNGRLIMQGLVKGLAKEEGPLKAFLGGVTARIAETGADLAAGTSALAGAAPLGSSGRAGTPALAAPAAEKSVTWAPVINNPRPEPASDSLFKTAQKVAFLGLDGGE